MKRCFEALSLAALLAASGSAIAAQCSIRSVPTLGFPNYDVFNLGATTTSQIAKIDCNGNLASMTVGIGKSATSGTIAGRQLGAGAARLNYNIYKDSGYSSLWGDGTAGTTALVVNNPTRNTLVPIYGKIDPGQDVSVGNYSDTVVFSVNP